MISLELARRLRKVTDYTPFVATRVAEPPWPCRPTNIQLLSESRETTRVRPSVNCFTWMFRSSRGPCTRLYALLFLLTAELIGALSAFGGLAADLNHLPIAWNLATIESISSALLCDRTVRHHLEENARARAEAALGVGYFANFLSAWNSVFRLKALVERAPRPSPPKDPSAVPQKHAADPPQYQRVSSPFPKQSAFALLPAAPSPAGCTLAHSRTSPPHPSQGIQSEENPSADETEETLVPPPSLWRVGTMVNS